MLGTAVLSFVLLQDDYKSVMLSGVFRTAIATVGSRQSGSCPEFSADDSQDLGTVRTAEPSLLASVDALSSHKLSVAT